MTTRVQGPQEVAMRAWLRERGLLMRSNPAAASAVVLAQRIDTCRGAEAAAAAISVLLRVVVADLEKAAEAAKPSESGIDDLRARRAARRAG